MILRVNRQYVYKISLHYKVGEKKTLKNRKQGKVKNKNCKPSFKEKN